MIRRPREAGRVRRDASIDRQLTHCPSCESDLIQIESLRRLALEATLVERRCPECDHADELELATVVADELCHRAAELASELHGLADRLHAAFEVRLASPH